MKILILEDELPAYNKIFSLINTFIPNADIIGWGRAKSEGEILLKKEPDLIFSDIMLLDGLSFDLFDSVKVTCPIIFCTAYDQYLFKAFQSNGIAYLLKPYNDVDFVKVYEKYKQLFSNNEKVEPESIDFLSIKEALLASNNNFKQRFTVKKNNGLKIVRVEDILIFEAQGDFSFIYEKEEKSVVNHSIGSIESSVDPSKFFRINRSEIISINYIKKMESYSKNRLHITLTNDYKTITSESRTPDFRKWVEG